MAGSGTPPIPWSSFISDKELREMFEKPGMTLTKMAEKLCVTAAPLSRKLKEIGIHIPRSGEFEFYKKLDEYPELLTARAKETAEKFNCHVNTVNIARRKKRNALLQNAVDSEQATRNSSHRAGNRHCKG